MVKAWVLRDKKYRNLFCIDEDRRKFLKIFNSLEDSRTWWTQLEIDKFLLEKKKYKASQTRISNRCIKTGRSHSVLRDFGISRLYFRRLYQKNQMSGIFKSSW